MNATLFKRALRPNHLTSALKALLIIYFFIGCRTVLASECRNILMQPVRSDTKITGEEVSLDLNSPLLSAISASSAKIVMIGDRHSQEKIRQKLLDIRFIKELKTLGFTHYIIEAPATKEMQEKLKNGDFHTSELPDRVGPYPWVEKTSDYQDIIELMQSEGMQIRAGDHPNTSFRLEYLQEPSYEQREETIAQTIFETSKKANRTLVLFGAFHGSLSDAENPLGITPAGARIVAMGSSVLSISFQE